MNCASCRKYLPEEKYIIKNGRRLKTCLKCLNRIKGLQKEQKDGIKSDKEKFEELIAKQPDRTYDIIATALIDKLIYYTREKPSYDAGVNPQIKEMRQYDLISWLTSIGIILSANPYKPSAITDDIDISTNIDIKPPVKELEANTIQIPQIGFRY